jgi:hypothetical protein
MKLSQIVALSRDNKSRSWCPVMTNAQLTQFFGAKPSRDLVLQRMNARRSRNMATAGQPLTQNFVYENFKSVASSHWRHTAKFNKDST